MYLIRKEGKQSCLSGWLPPHETRAQGPCEVGGQDLKRGRVEPQPAADCLRLNLSIAFPHFTSRRKPVLMLLVWEG